jgi:hypothetical protein
MVSSATRSLLLQRRAALSYGANGVVPIDPIDSAAMSLAASVVEKFVVKFLQPPQRNRIAGSAIGRLIGKLDQGGRVKAGGNPPQTQGGYSPVGVTTCAAEQVDLARNALGECMPEFGEQRRIITGGRRDRLVE